MSQEQIKMLTDMLNKGILTSEAYKTAIEALQNSSVDVSSAQIGGASVGNHTMVDTDLDSPSPIGKETRIDDPSPVANLATIPLQKNPHPQREVSHASFSQHVPKSNIGGETIVDSVVPSSVDTDISVEFLKEGSIIGDHRIISVIGEGGMGKVFRARHTIPALADQEGDVAIKLMKPSVAQNPVFQERFIREASLGKTIQHPNIARVHHVYSNPLALVLSYIDGKELRELIPDAGMPISQALTYLYPIAKALDTLHAKGIIHRDIKPDNIKIATEGMPILLDFGIAKDSNSVSTMTKTSMAMGTEAYMAPEQMNAKAVMAPADQYALAMTFYECICGSLPWGKTETSAQVVMRKMTQNFISPQEKGCHIQSDLWAIIKRGLSIEPSERFADCFSFLEALSESNTSNVTLSKRSNPSTSSRSTFSQNHHVSEPSTINLAKKITPNNPPTILQHESSSPPKAQPSKIDAAQKNRERNNTASVHSVDGLPNTSSNNKLKHTLMFIGAGVVTLLGISIFAAQDSDSSKAPKERVVNSKPSTSNTEESESSKVDLNHRTPSRQSKTQSHEALLSNMGIQMVSFPAHHAIEMGSSRTEEGRDNDEARTQASISKSFAISDAEITQKQYNTIMGFNPSKERTRYWGANPSEGEACSKYGVGDDYPVHCVSWLDSIKFCNRLSEKLGLEPVYSISNSYVKRKSNANGFRLPTEVEWIYAARGAQKTQTFLSRSASSLCKYANVSNSQTQYLHPNWTKRGVLSCEDNWAALAPIRSQNPIRGLYDMTGNLWEWTWSVYSSDGPNTRNSTSISLYENVTLRGGAWQGPAADYRLANRYSQLPKRHSFFVGFRIAQNTD